MPNRSNKDCRRRWWNSLAECTNKGPWTEEEDRRLIKAVRENGTNWVQVARTVASRNSDQCSSHWSQVLDPNINFADWTTEEDEALLHSVLTHGTNWATIATTHIPKRTSLALKNRYSVLRLKHRNRDKSKQISSARELSTNSGLLPDDNTTKFRPRKRRRIISHVHDRAAAGGTCGRSDDDQRHIGSDGDGDDDDKDNEEDDSGEDQVGDSNFDAGSVRSTQYSNITMATSVSSRPTTSLPTPDAHNAFAEHSDAAFNLRSPIRYGGPDSLNPPWSDEEILPALPEKSASHTMSLPCGSHGDDELSNFDYSPAAPWSSRATAVYPIHCKFTDTSVALLSFQPCDAGH